MAQQDVTVLAATGTVGQRFIALLEEHPWFRVAAVTGSERSVGQTYGEACRWVLDSEMPARVRDLPVLASDAALDTPLVFSALPSDAARETEARLAAAGHIVCTNASTYRMEPDVPLLIPEVNPDHLALIEVQRRQRGWRGAIVANPNCTSSPATMALRPLQDAFGLEKVLLVSMQALSGAGYPGVPSFDAVDNVIPFVGGEEPKVESEPRKMLGLLREGQVVPADFVLSAHCNRVPVLDGHLECLSLSFRRPPADAAELIAAMREFRALPQELSLPSAPQPPVIVRTEDNRPQIRRDRDAGDGMATVVGRVRPCPILDYKLVALAHNTIRGAAGGSILNAELMLAQGYLNYV